MFFLKERFVQSKVDLNLEMVIVLKRNQPISYRTRRKSFCDKENLRIIDDLMILI